LSNDIDGKCFPARYIFSPDYIDIKSNETNKEIIYVHGREKEYDRKNIQK